MKKYISVLLAICVVFCMTGCVSQDAFDALAAEHDMLQAEFDALAANRNMLQTEFDVLQMQYDSLNTAVKPHRDLLDAMDAEDYDTAMDIISEKKVAKQLAEKGDIAEYLVTVELTPDNFNEYFEWQTLYNVNTFGEEESWNVQYLMVSKAYNQGLILYQADAKLSYTIEFACTAEGGYTFEDSFDSNYEWTDFFLPQNGVGASQGAVYHLEKCDVTMNRIEGTVTFVTFDYVTGYELGEVTNGIMQQGTVTLVNGETLPRSILFGYKY